MTNIDNIDKVIVEVKRLLTKNEEFRKLLKYNTSDALSKSVPTEEDIDGLIKTDPAIYMNEDSQKITLTSFSVVYVPVITFDTSMSETTYMVDIFTKKEILSLDNNKLRLHQMLYQVYKSLDRARVSMAGRLQVKNASYVVIGTSYVGYQVEITVVDEPIENDL